VIVVRTGRIACDGVGGALGHPRVWLEMGEATFVECPYCDRRFVLAAGSEGPEDERWRRACTRARTGTDIPPASVRGERRRCVYPG
jgi:uncharacterized Zn-finger protein